LEEGGGEKVKSRTRKGALLQIALEGAKTEREGEQIGNKVTY